jgi:transposase
MYSFDPIFDLPSRAFWLCDEVEEVERYFGKWYGWAIRSKLETIKKVARMCKARVGNFLTFFVHRLT